MYRAKSEGKSRVALFDAEMHAEAMARLHREADLRRALQHRHAEYERVRETQMRRRDEVLGDPQTLFPNMPETLKAAATLVKDINDATYDSNPSGFTDVNGTLYFAATVPGDNGLFKSDGAGAAQDHGASAAVSEA